MKFIRQLTDSAYFKLILVIVAFMFIGFGASSVFQNNNEVLAEVDGKEFNFEDFYFDKNLKFRNLEMPEPEILRLSLDSFILSKEIDNFGLEIRAKDLPHNSLPNGINPSVIRHLVKDFQSQLLSDIIFYKPTGKLIEAIENLINTKISLNEYSINLETSTKILDSEKIIDSRKANKIHETKGAKVSENVLDSSAKSPFDELTRKELEEFYLANKNLFIKEEMCEVTYLTFARDKVDVVEEDIASDLKLQEIGKKYGLPVRSSNLISIEQLKRHLAETEALDYEVQLQEGYTSYAIKMQTGDATVNRISLKDILNGRPNSISSSATSVKEKMKMDDKQSKESALDGSAKGQNTHKLDKETYVVFHIRKIYPEGLHSFDEALVGKIVLESHNYRHNLTYLHKAMKEHSMLKIEKLLGEELNKKTLETGLFSEPSINYELTQEFLARVLINGSNYYSSPSIITHPADYSGVNNYNHHVAKFYNLKNIYVINNNEVKNKIINSFFTNLLTKSFSATKKVKWNVENLQKVIGVSK